MSEDKIDYPKHTQGKPWILEFFLRFLLADGAFIFLRQKIDPIPFSPNSTLPLNVMRVIVAFTALYLAAFVVGMILALVFGMLKKQTGKEYRSITWMRSLIFSSLPATYLLYVAWGSRHLMQ